MTIRAQLHQPLPGSTVAISKTKRSKCRWLNATMLGNKKVAPEELAVEQNDLLEVEEEDSATIDHHAGAETTETREVVVPALANREKATGSVRIAKTRTLHGATNATVVKQTSQKERADRRAGAEIVEVDSSEVATGASSEEEALEIAILVVVVVVASIAAVAASKAAVAMIAVLDKIASVLTKERDEDTCSIITIKYSLSKNKNYMLLHPEVFNLRFVIEMLQEKQRKFFHHFVYRSTTSLQRNFNGNQMRYFYSQLVSDLRHL